MKMSDHWFKRTELAKECILTYGQHDMKMVRYGNIGYVKYCQLCGEGEWFNLKNEVKLEEGIHFRKNISLP